MLPRGALLDELPRCDVVVLAAPATAETTGFVDERFLAAMAPDSVLVNVARGALIDEAALLAALERGRPAAAIIDVFATEPLPADSPFWDHPGVVLTPHSSAGGLARHGRVVDLFVENLERYRRGQPLLHEVRPAAGESTRTWLDERAGS
jgi:phosphoglycerate dehydrogenase-like enzyme